MALLADSQLLFGGVKGEPLSEWVVAQIAVRNPPESYSVPGGAIYIGAANGDASEFYQMAVDICRPWGVDDVVHVKNAMQLSALQVEDIAVVILAGGDVGLGWDFLSQPTVRAWLDSYTRTNGLIIGISAGAIHLASTFSKAHNRSIHFLAYCSENIAAHEESEDWPSVRSWQQCADDVQSLFIGLPFGGGLLVESSTTRLTEANPVGKGYKVFEKTTPTS